MLAFDDSAFFPFALDNAGCPRTESLFCPGKRNSCDRERTSNQTGLCHAGIIHISYRPVKCKKTDCLLSNRFTVVEIEHAAKPFAAMDRINGPISAKGYNNRFPTP